MRIDFHHLESQSVYDALPDRPVPSLPNEDFFNVSTASYENPQITVTEKPTEVIYGALLPPPKPFDEPMEPQTWLNEYEDIADGNNWDDNLKFLKVVASLRGAPHQWYSNEKRLNPNFNWKAFKEGLVNTFRNKCISTMSERLINDRIQQKGESLNSYWQDKVHMITTYKPDMPIQSQINSLFFGLEDDFREKLMQKFVFKKFMSLNQLYQMVKTAYDSYSFNQMNARKVRFSKKLDVLSEEQNEDVKPKLRSRVDLEPQVTTPQLRTLLQKVDRMTTTLNRLAMDSNNRRSPQYNYPSRNPEASTSPINNASNSTEKPEYNQQNRPPINKVQCWFCNGFGHYANRCPKKENPNQTKNYLRQN